jgi:transposase InsO family protein
MPWKETDAMKERVELVLEWERRWKKQEGQVNVAELCRMHGVSRECGHKWIRRYVEAGFDLRAVEERSRRPHASPTALVEAVHDMLVAARKAHPRWGPRKLRAWLVETEPGVVLPSASAIGEVLRRRGLTTPRRRRHRHVPPATQPFAACDRPNAVWCVDFKGWFRTGDGEKCYPLTITDAFSRYVLRCEALADPDGDEAQRVFDSAFLEFGLPDAIRSDNGPPFASTGPGGLTRLSVWWLRLGIRVERIEPGRPEQNGRHERMHLTLKLETVVQDSLAAQQRAFDYWRREFNQERPHEALGQKPPATVYYRSNRSYPRKLERPESGPWAELCNVDKEGFIRWRRTKVFISSALKHELVELAVDAEMEVCEVKYGPILLGKLDPARLHRGLILPRRRRRGAKHLPSLSLR